MSSVALEFGVYIYLAGWFFFRFSFVFTKKKFKD